MKMKPIRRFYVLITAAAFLSFFIGAGCSAPGETALTKSIDPGATWTVGETTNLGSLTIAEGATVEAPDGFSVTMTVDGVERSIAPGTYTGDVVLDVTGDNVVPYKELTHYFRQALYVDANGVVAEKSASSAIIGGAVTDEGADNIQIKSEGENFNGVFVAGGTYTLNNTRIDFVGNGANDFAGYGAAVMATGPDTTLIVDHSEIITRGAVRTALITDEGAGVIVKNSRIEAYDGVLPGWYRPNSMLGYMWNVPWMLGLSGNNRATNMLGDGTRETFISSTMASERWGVLSTDDGRAVTLTAINSNIETLGDTGYGAYAIGNGSVDQFYGCEFDVRDYGVISTGGTAKFGAITPVRLAELNSELGLGLTEEEMKPIPARQTTVNSGRFGFMSHEGTTAAAEVFDGTTFNCGEAVFMIRGVPTSVTVDGADGASLNSAGNVIMQVMDLDKAQKNRYTWPEDVPPPYGGSTQNVTTIDYVEPCVDYDDVDVIPDRDLTDLSPAMKMNRRTNQEVLSATAAIGTFMNITLTGDFYNGTTGANNRNENIPIDENTGLSLGRGGDSGSTLNMGLSFENVELTGVISSTYVNHLDPDTGELTDRIPAMTGYRGIAKIMNTPKPAKNNGVVVDIKNGSVWTVTGTSYLNRLTLDETSKIKAPADKTLAMTVNGSETPIAAGDYTGAIVLTVK